MSKLSFDAMDERLSPWSMSAAADGNTLISVDPALLDSLNEPEPAKVSHGRTWRRTGCPNLVLEDQSTVLSSHPTSTVPMVMYMPLPPWQYDQDASLAPLFSSTDNIAWMPTQAPPLAQAMSTEPPTVAAAAACPLAENITSSSPTFSASPTFSISSLSSPSSLSFSSLSSSSPTLPTSQGRRRQSKSAKTTSESKDLDTDNAEVLFDLAGVEEQETGNQEKVRRHFLERNRVAAMKCRRRKKQWLAELQLRATQLSHVNVSLQHQTVELREEIINLKTLLYAHKNCSLPSASAAMNPYRPLPSTC